MGHHSRCFSTDSSAEAADRQVRCPRSTSGEGLDCKADAETDMLLTRRPRAQFAFKDSMIHGILQFTLRIAFRCVLHRYESQDIRC